MNEPGDKAEEKTPAVPLLGTWRTAYFAVLAAFVLEVAFFYFVSRYFS